MLHPPGSQGVTQSQILHSPVIYPCIKDHLHSAVQEGTGRSFYDWNDEHQVLEKKTQCCLCIILQMHGWNTQTKISNTDAQVPLFSRPPQGSHAWYQTPEKNSHTELCLGMRLPVRQKVLWICSTPPWRNKTLTIGRWINPEGLVRCAPGCFVVDCLLMMFPFHWKKNRCQL